MNSVSGSKRPTDISTAAYGRERLQPKVRDPLYLHKKDLLTYIKGIAPSVTGSLLDFGCGCSPYRPLFSNVNRYLRADIEGDVDYVLASDMHVPLESESLDAVLSSQVLEHVRNPARYLAEARRLLRPGGKLILTTHGLFEQHGCPNDYYRWTANGLGVLLEESGFPPSKIYLITTGHRAAVTMVERSVLQLDDPRGTLRRKLARVFRCIYFAAIAPALNRWADRISGADIQVSDTLTPFYIAIGVVAST